ncbi:ACT domain-containing protein, partial [Arthrospira platensis SPKY1]|nr:ACT domain-containing protein [Arthrospira platensis SPKY1]
MRQIPGLAGQVFSALGKNGVNIKAIAQGSSERNISCVIEKRHETKALRALHDAFFLSDLKTVHLFMAGPGMIGSKVLELLHQQETYLKKRYRLHFRLVGVARSQR